MRQHLSLWLTLVAGFCLIAVAIATEDGWPAVIAATFILASLIGFAYGTAGEEHRSAPAVRRRRRRLGHHR